MAVKILDMDQSANQEKMMAYADEIINFEGQCLDYDHIFMSFVTVLLHWQESIIPTLSDIMEWNITE